MKLFNHPSLFLALALAIRAYSRVNVPNDVDLPSVRDDVAHKDVARRDVLYDRAVESGRAFWAQFSSNRYSAPITGGDVALSRSQGWEIGPLPPPTPRLDATLTAVLQELVGRLTARNRYYERSAYYDIHNMRRQYRSYRNLYGPQDGVIVALANVNNGLSLPMSNWSELSWRIWADTCASQSIDPKSLKHIIRHEIINGQTLDIIQQTYKAFPYQDLGERIVLLPSGRTLEGFQALLGSPNGKGVAWMLLNKRNVLAKTIAKITVELVERVEHPHISSFGSRVWDMWFELQDIAGAPLSVTSL